MNLKTYRVLDPNAVRIGGKRVSADRTVELNHAQASHELRIGSIEPIDAEKAPSADAGSAEALVEEAKSSRRSKKNSTDTETDE